MRRDSRGDISVNAHVTYFRGPHLGFTGEFTYIGAGNSDGCTVVQDGGDVELVAACNALKGSPASSATTLIQGGVVFRPLARSFFQPYVKAVAGVAFTPSSTIEMRSVYGSIADTALILTIYQDDGWHAVRPTWTAGFGVSTAPTSGYQLHIEARESWLPVGVVTGATSGQGFVPPHTTVIKAFPSILVGFDIVLEKRRGRRY